MSNVILDTDILSSLMRGNADVIMKARDYLRTHPRLTISIITRYEILRGLKAKTAVKQERAFERFSAMSLVVLPVTETVIFQAAEIYADVYKRGELILDNDIFIAATALVGGYRVITNNERHFRRITGLTVENWLKP